MHTDKTRTGFCAFVRLEREAFLHGTGAMFRAPIRIRVPPCSSVVGCRFQDFLRR